MALEAMGFGPAALLRLAPPVPLEEPYARLTLVDQPEVEVMLARWRAGATCAPHDHGAARGWVFFLEGEFRERPFSWNGNEWLAGEPQRRVEGDVVEVHAGSMHDCTSLDGGLSLHVYLPRIAGMQVLSLEARKTFVVADGEGAWVPAEPLREVAWG